MGRLSLRLFHDFVAVAVVLEVAVAAAAGWRSQEILGF